MTNIIMGFGPDLPIMRRTAEILAVQIIGAHDKDVQEHSNTDKRELADQRPEKYTRFDELNWKNYTKK